MADFFKGLGIILLATGMLAYLAGGFVAGMVWCEGCEGLLGNTLGRLFIGIVMCVLSAINGGFPPGAGGVGPPHNAWPYIFGCWGFLLAVSFVWICFDSKKRVP